MSNERLVIKHEIEEKLKPCRTNGCKSKVGIESHATTIPDYRIGCVLCGNGQTKWFKNKQEAIDDWNTCLND